MRERLNFSGIVEGKGNMERLTFHIRVGLDYYTGVFKDRKGGII